MIKSCNECVCMSVCMYYKCFKKEEEEEEEETAFIQYKTEMVLK